MAWYKMTCMHGGGHQSSDSCFIEAYDIEEAKDILDGWVHEHCWNNAIAKVTRVKRFKKQEKEKLVKDIKRDIERSRGSIEYYESQIVRLKARKD